MPCCAFVSFRFGPTDGVSVVARQWMAAFGAFGFDVVAVAGEGEADRIVPGLAIGAPEPPTEGELTEALADADLVVVENLATIPLNVAAALTLGRVLADRPAILHHHDPPWHRPRYAHVTELPLDDPAWRHVTITHDAASDMAALGFETTVIYNGFDRPGPGDRDGTRAELGLRPDDVLVAHPVRAIERKNLPAAIALAESLDAVYWLLGPPEEDYGPTMDALLAAARCRVLHRPSDRMDDVYAAADVVAYPSTWEGFGNPPIEAALRRRPVALGHYPFAEELRRLGFGWFEPDDAAGLAAFLREPGATLLDRNQRLARQHFSIEEMRERLADLLREAGWYP